MNLNGKALKEVVKSVGRFIYFGLLGLAGALITSLLANESLANSYVTIQGMKISVGFLIIAGLSALLKLVDRYKKYDSTRSNGIAPEFLQK